MGFPIVIGAKDVSSRRIAKAEPIEEYSVIDQSTLLPSLPINVEPIVFTTNTLEMEAIITLSYYNMLREDSGIVENCIAEIRIQIIPAGKDLSIITYRDSLYRIELPSTSKYDNVKESQVECHETDGNGEYDDFCTTTTDFPISPNAIFSADLRFLTCLIPHPNSITKNTTIIIFQLRKPLQSKQIRKRPPLPSYIHPEKHEEVTSSSNTSLSNTPTLVVATNPKILLTESGDPLLDVTCICDVGTSTRYGGPSLLLLACRDGTLLAASYRPLSLAGVVYQLLQPVIFMDHFTEWSEQVDGTIGRLAVVYNNYSVAAFRSHLTSDDENKDTIITGNSMRSYSSVASSTLLINLTETHEIISSDDKNPGFVAVKWIAGSYLAMLQKPDKECSVHVFGLYDQGKSGSVSSLTMSKHRLEEHSHAKFLLEPPSIIESTESSLFDSQSVSLEYDVYSDSLVVSAFLTQHNNNECIPFVCLWSWRSNSQGFVAASSPLSLNTLSKPQWKVNFFTDHLKKRRLILTVTSSTRIRKDVYEAALLSPPDDSSLLGGKIRQVSSILLSSTSVCFPSYSQISLNENFELQWCDAVIPKSYITTYGAPTIATVGLQLGRSIAVASSRGLCILDCAGVRKNHRDGDKTHGDISISKRIRIGPKQPRWFLFGNEQDERSFRVVAMTWWEDFEHSDGGPSTDDLLVAVIEVLDDYEDYGLYLACWSVRNLNRGGQLLRSRSMKSSDWGVRLRADFSLIGLNLLANPSADDRTTSSDAPVERKALVLLTDKSYSSGYQIFQLQTYRQKKPVELGKMQEFFVSTRMASSGEIGSPSALFLAGASFAFDLYQSGDNKNDFANADSFVATLGVIRTYGGGVDALSVSSKCVIAVGQVVQSADSSVDQCQNSELASFCLGDVIYGRRVPGTDHRINFFVWIIQLSSGRLLSWAVPFIRYKEQMDYMVQLHGFVSSERNQYGRATVHPKGETSLGIVCTVGSASGWMQNSTQGARYDYLCGPIPGHLSGCAIGVTQKCKRLHRSLGEEFEDDIFREDFLDHEIMCPGDFILYPPVCLPALYFHVHDAVSSFLQSGETLDYFSQHMATIMAYKGLQNTSAMSLQLLSLRSVEKLAGLCSTATSPEAPGLVLCRSVFASLVETVNARTTPLQFASLFLKVGRQIEPSCLPYLFPLPRRSHRAVRLEDLFRKSLANGSTNSAVAALPLLSNREETKSTCSAVFHHCLNVIDAALNGNLPIDIIEAPDEEITAVGDVFRYAMKLDEPETENNEFFSDDDDDDSVLAERGYSIMCGLPSIFGRREKLKKIVKTSQAPLLVNGIVDVESSGRRYKGIHTIRKLLSWDDCNFEEFKTVAGVASRYILSKVFDNDSFATGGCWKRISVIATLLIGDARTGFHFCSKEDFSNHARGLKRSSYIALLPLKLRQEAGLSIFFKLCCDCVLNEVDSNSANRVLDLILVLLADVTSDFESDIPGLLMISIVFAHAANRIDEILPESYDNSILWSSYFEAQLQNNNNTIMNGNGH